MKTGEVSQAEPRLKLQNLAREYLESSGYQVTEAAKLRGKSGVDHAFDILAQRDDGFVDYTIAMDIITGGDRDEELTAAYDLANKTYDTGIRDKALVALVALSSEGKEFALKQRVKIFEEEKLVKLIASKPAQPAKSSQSPVFKTKAQLLELLVTLGYTVEEKAKVRGRSGVEYFFDILAYSESGQSGHSLGIDIVSNGEGIGLD